MGMTSSFCAYDGRFLSNSSAHWLLGQKPDTKASLNEWYLIRLSRTSHYPQHLNRDIRFHMLQFRSSGYLMYSAYLRQPYVPLSQRSVRHKPSELLSSLVMFKRFQGFLSDFGEPISNDSGTRGIVRLYIMIGRYRSEGVRRGKEVKRCLPCSERWRSLSFVPRFVRGWPCQRAYNRRL